MSTSKQRVAIIEDHCGQIMRNAIGMEIWADRVKRYRLKDKLEAAIGLERELQSTLDNCKELILELEKARDLS